MTIKNFISWLFERLVLSLTNRSADKDFISILDLSVDNEFENWAVNDDTPAGKKFNWRVVQEEHRRGSRGAPDYDTFINDALGDSNRLPTELILTDRGGGDVPSTTIKPENSIALDPTSNTFSDSHGARFTIIRASKVPSLSINSCTVGNLELEGVKKIELESSQIGTLHIKMNSKSELYIRNCHIGMLRVQTSGVSDFSLESSRVHYFKLTSLSKEGRGSIYNEVYIDNCTFPVKHSEYYKTRSKGYTLFRPYLEKLEDAQSTHLFRAVEGASQFFAERKFFRFIIGLHGVASRYSLSPGRPLRWVFGIWLLLSAFALLTDNARISSDTGLLYAYCAQKNVERRNADTVKLGWRTFLCGDTFLPRAARSLWLPGQHITNPLGVFPRTEYIEARNFIMRSSLFAQDIINLILYFYLFFAIRRRFRM